MGKKLLLVDDEVRLVEALSHTLKKNGYVVDSAIDGNTGFEHQRNLLAKERCFIRRKRVLRRMILHSDSLSD